MNNRRSTRLTDEELKEKERLIWTKDPDGFVKRGSGKVPEDIWEMSRPNISADVLLKALLDDREQGR